MGLGEISTKQAPGYIEAFFSRPSKTPTSFIFHTSLSIHTVQIQCNM